MVKGLLVTPVGLVCFVQLLIEEIQVLPRWPMFIVGDNRARTSRVIRSISPLSTSLLAVALHAAAASVKKSSIPRSLE
jgi:hypothetical protein